MHPGAADKMASVWPRLYVGIMQKLKKMKLKDKHLTKLLDYIQDLDNPLTAGRFC